MVRLALQARRRIYQAALADGIARTAYSDSASLEARSL